MNPYNIHPYIRISIYRQCYEGWSVPTRTIHDNEFVLILGGNGSFTVEGKKIPVKKGMLFYFYPGLVHSGETELEDPMRFLAVHFSFSHVSFNNNSWSIEPGASILPLLPVQQLKNYHLPTHTLSRLHTAWSDKLPGYELISAALFQQFVYEVFQDLRAQNTNYSSHLKVEKIIRYMYDHINQKVTLGQLSRLVQLTPPYLSKIFKETTGYSVIEFFNKLKMDKAKAQIMDGNKKIKEIAESIGFKDEFYFSRIFKKIEGISPSEFHNKNVHDGKD